MATCRLSSHSLALATSRFEAHPGSLEIVWYGLDFRQRRESWCAMATSDTNVTWGSNTITQKPTNIIEQELSMWPYSQIYSNYITTEVNNYKHNIN